MTLNYNAGQGADKNWVVEETAFDTNLQGKCEAIMCLGNGYLGARSASEETYLGQTRNSFIAGTFNQFDAHEVTELPNMPDVFGMELFVDGERFALDQGEVLDYSRKINLRSGELDRLVTWRSQSGAELQIRFQRFISLANQHFTSTRVTVTPLTGASQIKIASGIDGQVSNSGSQHFSEGEKRIYEKCFLEQLQTTTESKVDVILVSSHKLFLGDERQKIEPVMKLDRRKTLVEYQTQVANQQFFVVEKQSHFYTSMDPICADFERLQLFRDHILEQAKSAYGISYDEHLQMSSKVWGRYWDEVDVTIEGTDFDQLAIRFAQYHMRVFTPVHDARFGVAAKGLSGEGYKGHSFWDSEIFVLPFFIYSQPEVARQLLEYRHKTINGARNKAKTNGYQGAMYPWESALDGEEVTPVWGAVDIVTGKSTKIWSGFIEQHITADIAYAIWTYYRVTGDQLFMDEMGYEIIFDTATFWTSRLEWLEDRQKWGINNVIGPDEYKEHIDNNAFTNYLAEHNIRLAMAYYQELKSSNPQLLETLESKVNASESYDFWCSRVGDIYLPAPREDGVIPQDDSYLSKKIIDLSRYKQQDHVGSIFNDYNLDQVNAIQVTKQADIMALFLLLKHRFSDDLLLKNWHYYEPKTLHDSSLSLSSHVVLATDVGDKDLAYELFNRAARIDLGPDMKTSDQGIHAASLGGIWQSVVVGFGGLKAVDRKLHICPSLPESWSRLSYAIYWQGVRIRVEVTQQAVELVAETPCDRLEVIVNGEARLLSSKVSACG